MSIAHSILDSTPIVSDHYQLVAFFGVLSYILFLAHWVVSTDWESKLNCCSLITALTGILYLHYSNVLFLLKYELFCVAAWITFLYFHVSIWKSNYEKVRQALNTSTIIASLKPYQGSIVGYLICLPNTKNASGQWNPPPFSNGTHVVLIFLYSVLLFLHCLAFFTPASCIMDNSQNCCRYNFVMNKFDTQSLNMNYCSGPVRIGFTGAWSTGKTSIISALLGHNYSTAQIAPAPTTDKFVCLALGATYSDPIRSDDYKLRENCEVMSHLNDVTYKMCGQSQPNVLDVADLNEEFRDFVFFDMPGFQGEYANDCTYNSFYSQLLDRMDFNFVVWDVSHGKIENAFANFFLEKGHGTEYELIYNRFEDDNSNMAFLNQQYGKMSKGHEILSEGYVLKLHENSTRYAEQFQNDILLLRSKILSINQTVHDRRKMSMKDALIRFREKISGYDSLRKVKIADRLIEQDLNIHLQPRQSIFRRFGVEL
mmetsp:Transcript_28910/g.43659  ORF Transcript_28910/g.43659 Transcript_28910/m.43659 type:complete len:483 (+) Transcript_28910:92-1540(+)